MGACVILFCQHLFCNRTILTKGPLTQTTAERLAQIDFPPYGGSCVHRASVWRNESIAELVPALELITESVHFIA